MSLLTEKTIPADAKPVQLIQNAPDETDSDSPNEEAITFIGDTEQTIASEFRGKLQARLSGMSPMVLAGTVARIYRAVGCCQTLNELVRQDHLNSRCADELVAGQAHFTDEQMSALIDATDILLNNCVVDILDMSEEGWK